MSEYKRGKYSGAGLLNGFDSKAENICSESSPIFEKAKQYFSNKNNNKTFMYQEPPPKNPKKVKMAKSFTE